jgi:predicted GTPase
MCAWKPNWNDECFYTIRYKRTSAIGDAGWVVCKVKPARHETIKATIDAGNCFKTREEAEFVVQRIKEVMRTNEEWHGNVTNKHKVLRVYYITHWRGQVVVQVVVSQTEVKAHKTHYNYFTSYDTASRFAAQVKKVLQGGKNTCM